MTDVLQTETLTLGVEAEFGPKQLVESLLFVAAEPVPVRGGMLNSNVEHVKRGRLFPESGVGMLECGRSAGSRRGRTPQAWRERPGERRASSPVARMRPTLEKGKEAEVGFEPTNNGFAIRPLSPLGYSAARRGGFRTI